LPCANEGDPVEPLHVCRGANVANFRLEPTVFLRKRAPGNRMDLTQFRKWLRAMQRQSRRHGIGILATEPLAESVCFNADSMWVALADGRRLGVLLADFPKLLHATARQRGQYVIREGGIRIHWDEIDEDISVRALVAGDSDRKKRADRSRPPERKRPERKRAGRKGPGHKRRTRR